MIKIVAYSLLIGMLLAQNSFSLQISNQECRHIQFGHILGGTLHSKKILKKRLLKKIEKKLPYNKKEALNILRKRYPNMNIQTINLTIRGCKVYFIGICEKGECLFDPYELNLKREES